jgi:pimeloyl-ACP methyl ester carboxylesterase
VDIAALLAGDTSSAPYTLSDMAQDTVGLLDALKLRSAHIVGASMGGAIGQAMAIEHPERMRTFTSIMSTTGDPSVGQPTQQALAVLLAPRPMDRDGAIEHVIANYRVIGSPGFEFDEVSLRERIGLAFDRPTIPAAFCVRWPRCQPQGTARRDCARCGFRPWYCTAPMIRWPR